MTGRTVRVLGGLGVIENAPARPARPRGPAVSECCGAAPVLARWDDGTEAGWECQRCRQPFTIRAGDE